MTTNEFMDRFIDAIEHNKKYVSDLLDIDLSQFFKTNSNNKTNTKKTHTEYILFNQIKNLDKDKYIAVANIVDKLSKN